MVKHDRNPAPLSVCKPQFGRHRLSGCIFVGHGCGAIFLHLIDTNRVAFSPFVCGSSLCKYGNRTAVIAIDKHIPLNHKIRSCSGKTGCVHPVRTVPKQTDIAHFLASRSFSVCQAIVGSPTICQRRKLICTTKQSIIKRSTCRNGSGLQIIKIQVKVELWCLLCGAGQRGCREQKTA